MNVKSYKAPDIPNELYQCTSNILRDAFRERAAQGLHFLCGSFTPEDVKLYFLPSSGSSKYLFVAWNEDKPIGILMTQTKIKSSFEYMRHDYLAVIDEYKGKRVASALFGELLNVCKAESCDFILSVTNPRASSSVKYHSKCGFKIYGKNYNGDSQELCFIYPIKKMRFVNFSVFRFVLYYIISSTGFILNLIRKSLK